MKSILKIQLVDGSTVLINEDQICLIKRYKDTTVAEIRLSNGEEILCVDPTYDAWENDVYLRQ